MMGVVELGDHGGEGEPETLIRGYGMTELSSLALLVIVERCRRDRRGTH
jgi:hypothetical protein